MLDTLKSVPAILDVVMGILALITGTGFLKLLKHFKRGVILEATTASIDAMLAQGMADAVANRDPNSFHTLDLDYEDGGKDCVPLLYGEYLRVLQNTSIQIIASHKDATIMALQCTGHGRIESHKHIGTEELTVIRGTVTCLKTGEVYLPGGGRRITEAGIYHGAALHNATCILVHLPPLPTAAERPVSFRQPATLHS